MSPLISLVAMLALASPQALDDASKAASIAPFVGDDVAAIVHLDLARWQVGSSFRRVLGKLADDPDLSGVTSAIDGRFDALKKLGATDLFVLIDPADMPGTPVVVVPLAGGGDAKGVAEILTGGSGSQVRWPKAETIRGAVIAGSAEAIARVREAKSAPRPELVAALASAGDAPIRIVLIPTKPQLRAIEESFPTLPPQVGGGPIEVVTRGMNWASIAIATEPRATLRIAVRARDNDSANQLRKVAQDALGILAVASRSDPAMGDLADTIARMKPEAVGDTIRLEADLEKAAALVAVPALQAREAARRSGCVNNLKQIGLAMHNYHSTHKSFPAAFVAGNDGKPLLSWRVLILPFLDEEELFKQFHLDEAWDGPHNKALIARMPRIYACPAGNKAMAAEGKTSYLTPRGPATVFPGAVGIKIQEVSDGTSNTILVVDASDDLAVTWTKPDDWSTAPEFTTQGIFGHHPRGTPFCLGDGAVRFFKQAITPKLLQALTTRNGGEIISADDY